MRKSSEKTMEEIYNFIVEYTKKNNFAPSVRDICAGVGMSSTSTVHSYLQKLKERNMIKKEDSKTRTLTIVQSEDNVELNPTHKELDIVNVPILGQVSAGMPIFAVENFSGYIPISNSLYEGSDIFALEIKGDSMINKGIFNKDLVFVRKQQDALDGEIVVALIDDTVTVKTFYKESDHIRLQPENDSYKPIIVKEGISILGKVTGVFRRYM